MYVAIKPSPACTGRWSIPGVGAFGLIRTTNACVQHADRVWPSKRDPDKLHPGWSWVRIKQDCKEMFTVIGSPSRDPAAIFASTRSSLVQLPIGNYYRLDYLEVAPNLRRSGLGVLAFAMVAVRAAEHGATGIILTSFNEPGLIQFYLDAGGVQECPRGWNAPANVVPFRFGNDALSRLQDIAHAHLDDP